MSPVTHTHENCITPCWYCWKQGWQWRDLLQLHLPAVSRKWLIRSQVPRDKATRKERHNYTIYLFHFGNEHHEVNGFLKCWNSPSWSINFPLSRKLKVHHRTHNSSRLVLILNWINTVNIPTFYWFKIRFNIILQLKNMSSEWYVTFPSAFSD